MDPWGHKLRILCGIYLPDIFYSLSTKSGWGVVIVPNLLHGHERILASLLNLLCCLNPDPYYIVQSCMQAGPLFTVYIPPLTPLAH
jgi:hypothetical protein